MRGSGPLARKADAAKERATGACTRGRARGASERSAERKSMATEDELVTPQFGQRGGRQQGSATSCFA